MARRKSKPEIHIRQTAKYPLSPLQLIMLIVILIAVFAGLIRWTTATLTIIVAAAIAFYVCAMGLKAVLQIASGKYKHPIFDRIDMDDLDLPLYTLFVPIYREANMVPGLIEALDNIRYPVSKLQKLLLVEERDWETRAALIEVELSPEYEVILVPKIKPYGKPKALNMGLARARGTFCTIYDAEDIPDRYQLLKAVSAFRASEDNVGCAQARLFFTNEPQSWVTRMYFAEYVVHYEFVLPGLAFLGLIPPLGGTSNHFRTDALRKIAYAPEQLPKGAEGIGGWDPWNVTEDAELAGALALHGYRVVLFDSVTEEEAAAKVLVAVVQRTRWIKGYMQTGLVYLRRPFSTIRRMGPVKWFLYVLTVLGTPVSLLLNPVFWGLTGMYFLAKSGALGGNSQPTMLFIEQLFPAPVFYTGIALFVGGNLLMFFQMVVACMHREGYGSVKYMLLVPAWWFLTSVSAYCALIELVFNISVWHKTPHVRWIRKKAVEADVPTPVRTGASR